MAEDAHQVWVRNALARYEKPLLRYAASFVGPGRARDVVQDTFLALCKQPRARVEQRLSAWLFTVCRNRAVDSSRNVRRLVLARDASEQDEAACPGTGPQALAETRQELARVRAALAGLPESEREVLHLKLSGELSYKEIAEVTGRSVSHVGVLLHSAVSRLRRLTAAEAPATPTARRAT